MENINYKMGWLLVLFDLPVTTKEARKHYTDFRTFLLEQGYRMIQYSVYARPCVTYARQETHIRRLKATCPPEGAVRAMVVTNTQWEKMLVFYGKPLCQISSETIPEQMQFW
ncbi:MAG: CRISPR-associated endonuclease Cas2 [Akkermansia sp.]